jgi:carotenoid cleavage dioxygenase-like enzyme
MTNRYLESHFAPLHEEYTLTDLKVAGRIPAYLDGRYLRNGPNPVGEIDPEAYYWFVGHGMVHGIRIRDGKAEWYRNRWARRPHTAKALGERPPFWHFGASPIGANTNVIGHAGKIVALIEAGVAGYELTGELDTIGVCDFDGTPNRGHTAHPKRDPKTGELHAVSHSLYRGNRIQYSVIGVDGRARRTVDIEVTGSPMMHDWTIDRADGKLRESRFDDRGQEFPRVDERLVGKRYRYGYAPVGLAVFGDTLLKHDFLRASTHRPQRARDPRRAHPAGRREHQAATSSAGRTPRQLGTDGQ